MAKADKEIMHYKNPICTSCKYFDHNNIKTNNETFTCTAFPKGIPEAILASDFDHKKPHPEDGGIKYEEMKQDFDDIINADPQGLNKA